MICQSGQLGRHGLNGNSVWPRLVAGGIVPTSFPRREKPFSGSLLHRIVNQADTDGSVVHLDAKRILDYRFAARLLKISPMQKTPTAITMLQAKSAAGRSFGDSKKVDA